MQPKPRLSESDPMTGPPPEPKVLRPLSPRDQVPAWAEEAVSDWLEGLEPGQIAKLAEQATAFVLMLGQGPLSPLELAEGAHAWVYETRCVGLNLSQTLGLTWHLQQALQGRHHASFPKAWLQVGEAQILVAQMWMDHQESHWQNITELSTKALQKSNKQLQQLDRSRSEFISTLSHELRTPLTAIAGSCELLLEDFASDLSGSQEEYIRLISSSAALIRQLIDDVLDYAKLEARKLDLHAEPLCLPQIVEDALMLVQPMLAEKHLAWEATLDPDLPLVMGDPVRIRQILLNLLSNAIKFTPEGGSIRIGAELQAPLGRRKPMLQLEIQDSGIGIAPEFHKAIFERFRQVPDKAKGGTGLGLPITRYLVELHGGKIWLESEEGRGTTFFFTLPLAEG